MSERYWITGTQLGFLLGSSEMDDKNIIVQEIQANQFIGNFFTERDQDIFEINIKKLASGQAGGKE